MNIFVRNIKIKFSGSFNNLIIKLLNTNIMNLLLTETSQYRMFILGIRDNDILITFLWKNLRGKK